MLLPWQKYDDYCRLLALADVVLDPPHYSASSSAYDILTAQPSAVSSYDTSQATAASLNVVLKSNQGLVEVNQYYTSATAPNILPPAILPRAAA